MARIDNHLCHSIKKRFVLILGIMKRENYRNTLTVAYLTTGLSQSFELAYNYLFFIVLSVDQIGLYSWVTALVMFFNVAVDMGIEPVLVRKFGKGELRLSSAFRAILLLRIPILVSGILLATQLQRHGMLNSVQFSVIMLLGAQIIFNVSDSVFKSWLLANDRQNTANIITLLFSGLKLGYIGILFSFSWNSLYYLLVGILVLRMVTSVIYCLLAFMYSLGYETASRANASTVRVAGELFRAGLSVGGVNFLGIMQNRLDWLLVSSMISTLALASYSLANKLYEILQLIVGVSFETMYPWLCRDQENERDSLLLLIRIVIAAGALLGLCGIFVSPVLVKLMFGSKFTGVELPVRIMMLSAAMIAASAAFYHLVLSRGRESRLFLITIIATALQFASNLYLIPRLGIVGAALGMLVLAIATITGLMIIAQIGNLVPDVIIRRILMFLSASIFYVVVLLYCDITAWFVVPVLLTVITCTGWFVLFDHNEMSYIIDRINGLARNFILGIRGISFRTLYRWE